VGIPRDPCWSRCDRYDQNRRPTGVTGNATPSLVMGVRLPGIGKVVGVKSAGRIRAAMPTAQACSD